MAKFSHFPVPAAESGYHVAAVLLFVLPAKSLSTENVLAPPATIQPAPAFEGV
jgi:hypothetical protein